MTERHLTQKARERKQRIARLLRGVKRTAAQILNIGCAPSESTNQCVMLQSQSNPRARHAPATSDSRACASVPRRLIYRIAISGRRRTPYAPGCTRLVIALIFDPGVLASYTPLADAPARPLRRGFQAFATHMARFMRCTAHSKTARCWTADIVRGARRLARHPQRCHRGARHGATHRGQFR